MPDKPPPLEPVPEMLEEDKSDPIVETRVSDDLEDVASKGNNSVNVCANHQDDKTLMPPPYSAIPRSQTGGARYNYSILVVAFYIFHSPPFQIFILWSLIHFCGGLIPLLTNLRAFCLNLFSAVCIIIEWHLALCY